MNPFTAIDIKSRDIDAPLLLQLSPSLAQEPEAFAEFVLSYIDDCIPHLQMYTLGVMVDVMAFCRYGSWGVGAMEELAHMVREAALLFWVDYPLCRSVSMAQQICDGFLSAQAPCGVDGVLVRFGAQAILRTLAEDNPQVPIFVSEHDMPVEQMGAQLGNLGVWGEGDMRSRYPDIPLFIEHSNALVCDQRRSDGKGVIYGVPLQEWDSEAAVYQQLVEASKAVL